MKWSLLFCFNSFDCFDFKFQIAAYQCMNILINILGIILYEHVFTSLHGFFRHISPTTSKHWWIKSTKDEYAKMIYGWYHFAFYVCEPIHLDQMRTHGDVFLAV